MTAAKWPYLAARYMGVERTNPLRLIVVHDMEAPEGARTAENVAAYFAGPRSPRASTHIGVDCDSIVQSVPAGRVAFAAPGANHDGFQIEHAGYARQSRAEWLDAYSDRMLGWSALAAAEVITLSRYFGVVIPVRRLTVAQIKDGKSAGFAGHVDINAAFHKSSHTDPGSNFPWDVYLAKVNWWLPQVKDVQFR